MKRIVLEGLINLNKNYFMKISKIVIENFRSFKKTEFCTTDFNIFVGQNNCGKTNFFEAMEFFFNGLSKGSNIDDLKFKRSPALDVSVEIEFVDCITGAAKMQHDANKTKIENALAGSNTASFVRSSTDPKKRKMFVNGNEVRPGTGFDAALNDFLPKFEYINTKQYYDSVAKYAKSTPIGIMFSGVLSTILQTSIKYQQFQAKFRELFEDDNSEIKTEFETMGNNVKVYLEKQFPDASKVKFEVSTPVFDDLLKNFDTTIDDGVETLAEEKGDGMQRALMLAIIQAYADYRRLHDDLGKSFLFFIDEAELHLHPSAQRKLKYVLHTLSSNNDQVFINTHSSVFVADNFTGQTIFKVEKIDGETEIEKATDTEKPAIVFELLGGSPADLLLPKNFLIIEGQSEFEFLSRVINRFYSDKPIIQLLKANGDVEQTQRTINAIEKVFSPLRDSIYKERLVILIDLPSDIAQGGVDEFIRNHRYLITNNQLFKLTARDLEQYYPNQADPIYTNWKKTQAELDEVNAEGERIFTSRKKKQLAKFVGNNITKEKFENEMIICFEALKKCWNLAY